MFGLYVVAGNSDNVVRRDSVTGAFEDEFLSGIDGANGLAFDEFGNLFVTSEWGHAVRQYAPDGELLNEFPVHGPIGILYVPEPVLSGPFAFVVSIALIRFRRRAG